MSPSEAEIELERIRQRDRDRLRRWRATHPEERKAAGRRLEAKRRRLKQRHRAEYDGLLAQVDPVTGRTIGTKRAFRLLLANHRDEWNEL